MISKFHEFDAIFIETDPESKEPEISYEKVSIDISSITSFNSSDTDINTTTVRLIDGSAFDLRISYLDFKRLMKRETVDHLHIVAQQ